MSYILDALRKSERERQRGSVPDVLTVQEGARQQKRRAIWPALLILALLLNAALIVWWLTPLRSSPSARPAATLPAADPAKADSGPAAAALAGPDAEARAVDVPSDKTPAAEVKAAALKTPEAVQQPARQESAPREKGGDVNRKSEKTVDDRMAETETLPPAENRVYRLKELPEPLRKTLPEFSITAFLYSATPASRMARINGRMFHEGENLSTGLRLEEITPDGVVMSSRGYRFSVAVQ